MIIISMKPSSSIILTKPRTSRVAYVGAVEIHSNFRDYHFQVTYQCGFAKLYST